MPVYEYVCRDCEKTFEDEVSPLAGSCTVCRNLSAVRLDQTTRHLGAPVAVGHDPANRNRHWRYCLRHVHAALLRIRKRAHRLLDDGSKIKAHDVELKLAGAGSLVRRRM